MIELLGVCAIGVKKNSWGQKRAIAREKIKNDK